jgi:hypothetical protein
MSEAMQNEVLEVRKWIRRLHIKSKHRLMLEGEIVTYADYKKYLFLIVNQIREYVLKLDPFTEEKFDEAWQYRTMAHEDWEIAKDHIINTVLGWW